MKCDYGRLVTAINWSRGKMEKMRSHRQEMIKQYVGPHTSDNGSAQLVPVNFVELTINIYLQNLVANYPQVLVVTEHDELKPTAETLKLALNHLMKQIDFRGNVQRCVLDAFFGVGIAKIGLNQSRRVEFDGFLGDVGQPYFLNVSLDDFVLDMTASRWEQCSYFGDRYRLPLEEVKASGIYNKKAVAKLESREYSTIDDLGEERSKSISAAGSGDQADFLEMVELWDIWLPRHNLLLTVDGNSFATAGIEDGSEGGDEINILREVEWQGPEGGPYKMLPFHDVPETPLPTPPTALWCDMHHLANDIFLKLDEQAKGQRTILGVQAGHEDDGEKIRDAGDGEVISLANPKAVQEYKFGGIDQVSLAYWIQLKDVLSWFAGNLDSLGGLSPMADTLGQDKLLASSASKRIASMQDRVTVFVSELLRDLAWYLWTDPFIDLPLTKRVKGAEDIGIPVRFNQEAKDGDYLDYNFEIVPYSMQYKSPAMRVQAVMQVVQQLILPLMPMMQQQGVAVNMAELLNLIAEHENLPELKNILEFSGIAQDVGSGPVGEPPEKIDSLKPAVTQRTYERVNRPGSTRMGADQSLVQSLLGKGIQPAEAAGIGRGKT